MNQDDHQTAGANFAEIKQIGVNDGIDKSETRKESQDLIDACNRHNRIVDPGFLIGELPILTSNCIEHVLRWIKDYDFIWGCQYYLTNESILKELCKKKHVDIVVQYWPWMDDKNARRQFHQKNFRNIKRYYPKMQSFRSREEAEEHIAKNHALTGVVNLAHDNYLRRGLAGIGVYRNTKTADYEHQMHSKFLIGYSEARKDFGIVFGSFNLSKAATNKLETVMIWHNQEELFLQLMEQHHMTLMTGEAIHWEDFIKTKIFIKNDETTVFRSID